MSKKKLDRLLGKFDDVNILVVGDLMLDRFVWGSVNRISPEAPVPVVEVTSESDVPGGAANVVNNIRSLGGRAYVCGIIGKDTIGEILLQKLNHEKIDLGGVIVDPHRTTTLKTRIIAHSQQMVRVDKESTAEIPRKEIERIISYVESIVHNLGAIIIEDYGKGLVTQRLVAGLVRLSREHDTILAVDPKRGNIINYRGITLMTPNRAEALWLAGEGKRNTATLEEVGERLLRRLACRAVLITLGEQGMCLFQRSRKLLSIPTTAREVYDVSGAGDTVISTFTLALAAGASMAAAAVISNYAAGVVVGKVGTATANQKEIVEAMFP
ncbi:MAG: D-glycero-beta-D-manno-heptose-7-phosphate kinase [Candidatus Aureabacteria bacterium]|nr:D-glycero-beta-D-manno-heptose-7-phosphate kinase [Candidatus Auribacterota bacterium]